MANKQPARIDWEAAARAVRRLADREAAKEKAMAAKGALPCPKCEQGITTTQEFVQRELVAIRRGEYKLGPNQEAD